MLFCQHRINDPAKLAEIPDQFGVEIDIRSIGDRLILEHDPFAPGPSFEEWLEHYHHAFIVLNVKEEGLETRIAEVLGRHRIFAWAFLDQSFPFLVRSLRAGETRSMVRLSEYESIQTVMSLETRPDWVWVDSFTGRWPSASQLRAANSRGHRLMIVSPELQGRAPEPEIAAIRRAFEAAEVPIDGVCSKRPDLWV